MYRNETEANIGASLKKRFTNKYTYTGAIPDAQAQYVIVDDNYTSGNTIIAMIEHIMEQGGTVSAVSILIASRYGKGIKPSEYLLEKLKEIPNFIGKIEEEYGKGIEYFTAAELRAIYLYEVNRRINEGIEEGLRESTQGHKGTCTEEEIG